MTGGPLVQKASVAAPPSTAGTTVFRYALAAAALFHLAGNPALGFGMRSGALVVVQALVGAAAIAVMFLPRRELPLVLLCLSVPVSAWFEAPMVGNHWVLAAAVCLTTSAQRRWLPPAANAATRCRRGRGSPRPVGWCSSSPTGSPRSRS